MAHATCRASLVMTLVVTCLGVGFSLLLQLTLRKSTHP